MPSRPSVQPRDPKDVARAAPTRHVPRPTARTVGTAKKTGCRHSTSRAAAFTSASAALLTGRATQQPELSQPDSSPERAARACLLLDRVRMLPNRSSIGESDIISTVDHHLHRVRAAAASSRRCLPRHDLYVRVQRVLGAHGAGCMEPAPGVRVEVPGTDRAAAHAPRSRLRAASMRA